MTSWADAEIALLRAVLDRIIPADQDPGATDLGTDRYVLVQLAGDAAEQADPVRRGLAELAAQAEREDGRAFPTLGPDRQDALLAGVEATAWFRALAELAAEGYYADPDNGGNAGARSWRMIGYEHRLPDGPSGPSR